MTESNGTSANVDRSAEIEQKKKQLESLKKIIESRRQNAKLGYSVDKQTHMTTTSSSGFQTKSLEELLSSVKIPELKKVEPPKGEEYEDRKLKQSILKAAMSNLSISLFSEVNIPKKDNIYYDKEVQTENDVSSSEKDVDNENCLRGNLDDPQNEPSANDSIENNNDEKKDLYSDNVYKMPEQEVEETLKKHSFEEFFHKATVLIERALGTGTDVCLDYSKEVVESKEEHKIYDLKEFRKFYNPSICKNRTISCLDWSVHHPELLLASYVVNDSHFASSTSSSLGSSNPDGLVVVWNTRYSSEQAKQEYSFHFQSPVTSACFSHFHPNLIIGGTYSGRIVLWDIRTGKMMPVQRSNVSTNTHTFPVFCTKMVGTQNAHNLVSLSSDGRMCTWTLDMFSQPTETIDLLHKKVSTISATSVSFIADDANHCVIGSEEGKLFTVQRLGNKTGVVDIFDDHYAPVTAIHCHPANSDELGVNKLFLSSSMDWTLKLWSTKHNQPLCTFDDYTDYVCDVAWSPTRPSIFACVDARGKLDIWNINKSIEAPVASVEPATDTAFSKVAWNPSGNLIAVGGEDGYVSVFSVESINHEQPNEKSIFMSKIDELKSKFNNGSLNKT